MSIMEVIPSPGKKYRKEDLLELDQELLGALLRQRVHHNIEVPLYSVLQKKTLKPIPNFGLQAQLVFEAWEERNLPQNRPDIEWAKQYISIAEKIRNGQDRPLERTVCPHRALLSQGQKRPFPRRHRADAPHLLPPAMVQPERSGRRRSPLRHGIHAPLRQDRPGERTCAGRDGDLCLFIAD